MNDCLTVNSSIFFSRDEILIRRNRNSSIFELKKVKTNEVIHYAQNPVKIYRGYYSRYNFRLIKNVNRDYETSTARQGLLDLLSLNEYTCLPKYQRAVPRFRLLCSLKVMDDHHFILKTASSDDKFPTGISMTATKSRKINVLHLVLLNFSNTPISFRELNGDLLGFTLGNSVGIF